MRVLVIDDEDSARCAVAQGLRAAGVEVLEAADGPAGLAKALDGGVDLVVLDLRLPGMDGEAVLATLRRSSAVPVGRPPRRRSPPASRASLRVTRNSWPVPSASTSTS